MKNAQAEGARWLQQVSAGFERIRLQIAKLDRYYIPTRYPNGLPEGAIPPPSSTSRTPAMRSPRRKGP